MRTEPLRPGTLHSILALSMFILIWPSAHLQAQYQTADEAWRAGTKQLAARNYAASQEPLEAALRLAPDDAFRLKVYEALMPAYRQLPEPDKFIEACDF